MTKAKRRSIAQKIGRQGELIFEAWATAGNFNANKLHEDYGVDYLCQQLLPSGQAADEVSGLSVLVQVRATSTEKKPRIGMNREDVETALRHTGVFCLAGVRMGTKEVSFRFLDIALLEEWSEFLKSDRETITIRLDAMHTGVARFSEDLITASRPARRARFAEARIRMSLEAAIPGSALRVNSGARGDWAVVSVPNLLSIVNAGADQHELLAAAMFRPTPFAASFKKILASHSPHKALFSVSDLTDGPVLVAGGAEEEIILEIRNGPQQALCPFTLRRVGDERAYIGSSGLVLRITDSRRTRPHGEYVHELTWTIVKEGSADLQSCQQLDFLRMLTPGASLNEAGRPLIPVEHFGVEGLGRSVRAIELVFSNLGLPLTGASLGDLLNEIFAINLGVLEALATEGSSVFPSFVLGLGEGVALVETQWTPCRYRVPITMRVKEHGVLAWVEGIADAYIEDDAVRGFRFKTREATEIGLTELSFSGDGRATAHFAPGWLPMVLGPENPEFACEPFTPFHHQGQYRYG